MKLSELFFSIQGEGKLAGVPSVFIRTTGCNLRCSWCDTPYTSWQPEGSDWSIDQIIEEVRRHPASFVVITGGEPMIQPEITELTARLRSSGLHITVETAGTVWREVDCDLASISPKLANSTPWEREGGRFARSHEEARINFPVIRRLREAAADYQLKFVVESEADLEEIRQILDELSEVRPEDVLLMPEGRTTLETHRRAPQVAEVCKRTGFRYCPRLHLDLYGNTRGT